MSEPVAKARYFGEPRNAFDLEEIERRMRESIEPQPPAPEHDPLAELARLVGQANNDAFSKIFEVQGGPTAPPPPRAVAPGLTEPPPVTRDGLYAAAFDPHPEPRAEEPGAYAQPHDYDHESAQQGYEQGHGGQAYDGQHYAYAQQPAYAADGYAPQEGGWQDQGYAQQAHYQEPQYAESDFNEPPRWSLRAKLLIGAAALVVAGGTAGAFIFRGPGGFSKEAPTIMANAGPTKVQPAEQASDGPKPSISILERGAPGNAQSKVVQNEEQPVDVAATARASGVRAPRAADAGGPVTLAPPPPPPVANSIFAEPKRVKAVAVRPDGSIIDPNAPAAATPPTPPVRAEAPVAAPATPAAPAARATDMAALVASTTPGSGPKPAAARPAEPKPAKPAVVAAAPATTASIPAPTGAGGAFSVQLAGTTSPEEAKDAVERMSRKYASELGGYRPSVVKAEVGSKTVYRIRVKGLSSEDANTLCARLKSGGGSCFVARN